MREASLFQRGLQRLRDPLYLNALLLILSSVVAAVFGVVFWLIVARFYSSEAVGTSATLVALASFTGTLSSLGLGYGLIRFLPEGRESSADDLNTSLTLSGAVAVAVAISLLASLEYWSPPLVFLQLNAGYGLLFLLFTIAFAWSPIVTNCFLAFRKASYALYKSVIYNVIRLPLPLGVIGLFGAFAIFFSIGTALVVSIFAGLVFLIPRVIRHYRPSPKLALGSMRAMLDYSLGNHVANRLASLPAGLLPLIILNQISPSGSAHFYVAWIIAGFLFVIPGSSALSLFVEGSHPETHFSRDAGRSLAFGVLILLPGVLVLFFGGSIILGLFGKEYSTASLRLLRLLAISAFFVAVNTTFISYLRVRRKTAELILVSAALGIGIIVASFTLIPYYGLLGPGIAFLGVQGATSGYALARHQLIFKS